MKVRKGQHSVLQLPVPWIIVSASQFHVYLPQTIESTVNVHLAQCLIQCSNVKAVVATFNQEKALVGAFFVITNVVCVSILEQLRSESEMCIFGHATRDTFAFHHQSRLLRREKVGKRYWCRYPQSGGHGYHSLNILTSKQAKNGVLKPLKGIFSQSNPLTDVSSQQSLLLSDDDKAETTTTTAAAAVLWLVSELCRLMGWCVS